MGIENIYKDYELVAKRIHDGECVLEVPLRSCTSKVKLLENTLADRVDVLLDCDVAKALKRYSEFTFDVIAFWAAYDYEVSNVCSLIPELTRVLKPAGRLLLLTHKKNEQFITDVAAASLIPELSAAGKAMEDSVVIQFMRNPLVGRGLALDETCWKIPDDPGYNMNAFNRDYLNPWLVRGIVSGCGKGRLENNAALAKIRDEVLATYPPESVDAGAALCGKIYASNASSLNKLVSLVESYVAIENPIPHQLRWQVSCGFALATLAEKSKQVELAKKWYSYVADADVAKYSPTLGTKVMDACWQLANLALNEEDVEQAIHWLRKSFERADEIVHAPWLNVVGSVDRPVPIAYEEVALVCQKAARAAGMMNVLDRYPDRLQLARRLAVSNAERMDNLQKKLKDTKGELEKVKAERDTLKKAKK